MTPMPTRHPRLLDPRATALLVVDVQEKFRTVIHEFEPMLAACVRLTRAFRLLDLPALATEQYPRGLGRTVPELALVLGDQRIPEKTQFSALACSAVPGAFRLHGTRHVVVCGIETHVCVMQTVHDLLAMGIGVHVAVDAVSSRRPLDREVALRRMELTGAVLTTSEAVAFEVMVDARHGRFREVQALFK